MHFSIQLVLTAAYLKWLGNCWVRVSALARWVFSVLNLLVVHVQSRSAESSKVQFYWKYRLPLKLQMSVLSIDRLVFDRSDLSHISTVQEGAPGKSKSCLILQEGMCRIVPTVFLAPTPRLHFTCTLCTSASVLPAVLKRCHPQETPPSIN